MRSSENCNRGSSWCSHRALVFMEEVAGVSEEAPLYMVMFKEVLATSLPGQRHRQAPRIPTVVLASFEVS